MTPGWKVRVRGPRHGGTVRAENRVHGSDQKSCSPNRPAVMITDDVPAVRLPLDHTCDLMAAAIPPPGRMEDHGDLDPAPPARRTAILSEGLPGSPRQPTSARSRPGSGCSSRKSTACQADRSRSSQGMRGRRGGARLRRRSGGSGRGMGRDRRSVAAEDPAAQHVRVDTELAARGARPGAPCCATGSARLRARRRQHRQARQGQQGTTDLTCCADGKELPATTRHAPAPVQVSTE